MKKHLHRSFLPYNYERTLYNKIQALRQGTRCIDEYATEFFHLSARSTLMETEAWLVHVLSEGYIINYKLHYNSLILSQSLRHISELWQWKFNIFPLGIRQVLVHRPKLFQQILKQIGLQP